MRAIPPWRRTVAALAGLAAMLAGCSAPATQEPPSSDDPSSDDPSSDEAVQDTDPGTDDAGGDEDSSEPAPAPDVEPAPPPEPEPALGAHGVSAGDGAAVDAGMRMLEQGGTAVDAAIAAAFAVSVVEPFASGIGGGGAALVVEVDGAAASYDYREVVPAEGIPTSDVGVPGFVVGMSELHADRGELPWEELLAPAVELADEGVPASGIVAAQLRSAAHRLPVEQLPEFFPDGAPLSEGDELRQPGLADTLRTIADEGAESVRDGAIAQRLVDEVGGLDAASLRDYGIQRTDPPRGAFADLEVVAAAPPLPGVALIQLLQVAEALDIEAVEPGSADFVHRLSMAWRAADRSVDEMLGDPDFTDVPVAELTDPDANAQIAATIDDGSLLASGSVPRDEELVLASGSVPRDEELVLAGAAPGDSPGNTTHITVVDEDGTVVSMTNTLTNFWGSGQRVGGFFLNNQMSRFSIGGGANEPEPGRRSVSWSLPMVVIDDEGRPVLGMGSPGGRRIPNIEAGVLTRWALHGASLADAVEADRFHLEGDTLRFEELPDDDVAADLLERGYADLEVPDPVYYFGSVQALEVDHDAGTVTGAADPRREGDWDSSTR